ncbi:MAG TPA: IPT/TIG domain-containing protein, partial [Terriglobales bacterium]|nr:IPT/TIG domain-containing protein [Terriglobales bacterium]
MTTRSWTFARVFGSGLRALSPRQGWGAAACLLALCWLGAPGSAHAQGLGNFCPIGTCDITNPHYVNVYWDSSLAQWDTDVAANTPDMAHDHIDHLTESLIHSKYFADLTQYSVTSVSMGPSISASGCAAAPATLDKALAAIPTLVNCLLLLYPSLKADNVILAVYVPPQSMVATGFCQKKGDETGEHQEYGLPVGNVLFLPTTKPCNNGSLAALFGVATHEMVEATTDPNPPSPTGWKVGTTGDFYGQEVADVCQTLKFSDVGFLFGGVANYFSDNANTCSTGFTKTAPTVSTATSCGSGQNMTLKLTGSFGATPWDLGSGKFGKETLYLNAVINHQGKQWEAGNFEGLPRDSNLNQGKPDLVTFGAGGVSWSPGTITVSGFGAKYGTVMANGATAAVFPGDSIQVKVALNDTGQFATANLTAPSASQILSLAVTPTGGDPYIFVNAKADVTGTVADAGKCGVQSQLVSLMGFAGFVNPGSTGTSASGQFQSSYFAPTVAGTQKVTATLANNNSVTASVPVPVHPILNSITPNVGPVAGGQNATLAGDGFDPGNTSVGFS